MNSFSRFLFTILSLVAFAGNSVLCKIALGGSRIDPASFTFVRLGSAAVVLGLLILVFRRKQWHADKPEWKSIALLFGYALPFSYAYVYLDTGTGALILFGAVQTAMFLGAMVSGESPSKLEWLGFGVAFVGFVYLVGPGLQAPPWQGAVLMSISGFAWGAYSLLGKSCTDPLVRTARNFIYSAPIVLIVGFLTLKDLWVTDLGVFYAVLSGALASGLGYTIWYLVLPYLRSSQAATVQLFVPILAAIGGFLFMGEMLTLRLGLASLIILGGITVGIYFGKAKPSRRKAVESTH